MSSLERNTCSLAFLIALSVQLYGCSMNDEPTRALTVKNLQAAYATEIAAQSRFEAFARRADDDGRAYLAKLFRGAARASEIEGANHAEAIRNLDAVPNAPPVAPVVRGTEQNLRLAIDTMRASCQSLYPPALSQAQDAGNADAARTFNFSRMAQESNLQLFELAAADSASWKSNVAEVHICTVCGWLSLDERFEKCPICFAPKAQMELMR